MSTDTSVSVDAAVDPASAPAEPEEAIDPRDECATTAGGPTMVLLFTGGFVLVSLLRRHRRKKRRLAG
jgi:hypothetical protein